MSSHIIAFIIQDKYTVFMDGPNAVSSPTTTGIEVSGVGTTNTIPCPDAAGQGRLEGDYWATPVNNENYLEGFTYKPYNLNEQVSSKPTPQSFAVIKVENKRSNDWYYVVGTSAQYLASCAVCCGDSPVAMPTVSNIPLMAGCQVMCNWNNSTDKKYFANFGLPTLTGNKRYFPYGYFKNVALTAGSSTGYATTAALLTFLNGTSDWAAIGTWSVTGNLLIVTQNAGPGTDTICVAVAAINPSI